MCQLFKEIVHYTSGPCWVHLFCIPLKSMHRYVIGMNFNQNPVLKISTSLFKSHQIKPDLICILMCGQKIQSVTSRVFPPQYKQMLQRAERWSPLWSCISTHTGRWLVRCHSPSPPGSSSMPRLGSRLGGHPGTLDVRSKYICGCSIHPSLWDRLPSPGCCLHAKLGCLLLQDPPIPSLPFSVSPETSLSYPPSPEPSCKAS